ncbi:uncharacterized protein SCODWIG_01620 [Saccharomycodes ludwigii]|uniref:Cyclic nucleotide-binding domain-containing protein n=1 Tax=Saccharomycodes ludwigii TaxID=36035 RepID=A0A376B5K7_9ASCO|nr:uncharacterized protein SCODWIG_01620 [Saccharomycodes ludwigii]
MSKQKDNNSLIYSSANLNNHESNSFSIISTPATITSNFVCNDNVRKRTLDSDNQNSSENNVKLQKTQDDIVRTDDENLKKNANTVSFETHGEKEQDTRMKLLYQNITPSNTVTTNTTNQYAVQDRNNDIIIDQQYTLSQDLNKQFLNSLMKFSLFQNAPKAFYVSLARKLKLVIYHSQEYIVKCGEPSKSMYWIFRGSVKVTSPDGEITQATLKEGSYFGEIGILFNRPRTATVIAETKVLLGVLTSDNLNQVLPDFPIIERQIRDEAQERLAMQEMKRKAGVNNILVNVSGSTTNSSTNTVAVDTNTSNISATNISTDLGSALQANSNLTLEDIEDSISIRQFLKSLPLFTTLPADIIHGLALCVELRNYNAFEYILRKGEFGYDIYFIISGEVEVLGNASISTAGSTDVANTKNNMLSHTPNIEILLGRLGPGQYFGEMGFLQFLTSNNKSLPQRTADIRSVSTSYLLVLTGDTLRKFCDKYPFIKREMKKTAQERNLQNAKSTSFTKEDDDATEPKENVITERDINVIKGNDPIVHPIPLHHSSSGILTRNGILNNSNLSKENTTEKKEDQEAHEHLYKNVGNSLSPLSMHIGNGVLQNNKPSPISSLIEGRVSPINPINTSNIFIAPNSKNSFDSNFKLTSYPHNAHSINMVKAPVINTDKNNIINKGNNIPTTNTTTNNNGEKLPFYFKSNFTFGGGNGKCPHNTNEIPNNSTSSDKCHSPITKISPLPSSPGCPTSSTNNTDRKSTRLNSSHTVVSRMPSSA